MGIQVQQLETSRCVETPVGVTAAAPKRAPKSEFDILEFTRAVRCLGLLLGIFVTAVDMGCRVLLLQENDQPAEVVILSVTAAWHMGTSLLMCVIITLIRHLIKMLSADDEIIEAFEHNGLIWSVMGVVFGCTVIDVFSSPAPQYLIRFGAALFLVGLHKILVQCIQRLKCKAKADHTTQQNAWELDEAMIKDSLDCKHQV